MSVPVPELPAQVPGAWSQAATASARGRSAVLVDGAGRSATERAGRGSVAAQPGPGAIRAPVAGRARGRRSLALALPAGFRVGARPVQDAQAKDSYFHASIDMVWELGLFGAAPTWPPPASRACACRWSRSWCATTSTWAWPTVRSRC
ncbi:hypothetical protein WJ968_15040 [Achromobacter xylosoxidans]